MILAPIFAPGQADLAEERILFNGYAPLFDEFEDGDKRNHDLQARSRIFDDRTERRPVGVCQVVDDADVIQKAVYSVTPAGELKISSGKYFLDKPILTNLQKGVQ